MLGAWEVTGSYKGALSSLWQGFNQDQAVTGRRLRGTSGLEAGVVGVFDIVELQWTPQLTHISQVTFDSYAALYSQGSAEYVVIKLGNCIKRTSIMSNQEQSHNLNCQISRFHILWECR